MLLSSSSSSSWLLLFFFFFFVVVVVVMETRTYAAFLHCFGSEVDDSEMHHIFVASI